MITKRITTTINIYCYNQIVDSYKIDKPIKTNSSKEAILNFHENLNYFYEDKEIEKMWNYYYVHIPLNDMEIVANGLICNISNDLKDKLRINQKYLENLLININFNWKTRTELDYKNILKDSQHQLSYLISNIKIKQEALISHYITCIPILKHSQTLYFNIMFNQYLSTTFLMKRPELDRASYQFIKKNLHLLCTNPNDIGRKKFFTGFENLKKVKIYDKYIVSYNNKQRLYKFIIYLKTYYKITKNGICEFSNEGYLIQEEFYELLAVFYYRENKKYFNKYFGKDAIFKDFINSQI